MVFSTLRTVRTWRALLWGSLLWALACAGQAHTVVVVSSDANTGIAETTQAAVAELVRLGVAADDIGRVAEKDFAKFAVRGDARVYLTLGVQALREVLKANVREPVVAALIPRLALEHVLAEASKRAGAGVSALYLDQPLARQLDLVRLALPEAKRIGLVFGPESQAQQSATVAALKMRSLEPVIGQAMNPEGLFAGLKPALEEADAVLAIPDPAVFNNQTVASILTATYRARIPLIAFSPAYVKAGALLCVYSTTQQMAAQAAAMVLTSLRNPYVAASQYPQEFGVRVNDSVARSLGLNLREEQLYEQLRRLERKP